MTNLRVQGFHQVILLVSTEGRTGHDSRSSFVVWLASFRFAIAQHTRILPPWRIQDTKYLSSEFSVPCWHLHTLVVLGDPGGCTGFFDLLIIYSRCATFSSQFVLFPIQPSLDAIGRRMRCPRKTLRGSSPLLKRATPSASPVAMVLWGWLWESGF